MGQILTKMNCDLSHAWEFDLSWVAHSLSLSRLIGRGQGRKEKQELLGDSHGFLSSRLE